MAEESLPVSLARKFSKIVASVISILLSILNNVQISMRQYTTSISVNKIIIGAILLWSVVILAINTRAIVSPFHSLASWWLIFASCLFLLSHYFSRKLSSKEAMIQSFTIVYFLLLFYFISLIIWPNFVLFEVELFGKSAAVVTIFFISSFTGILTGDLAQTDSLGDSFFRHHILPKMENKDTPIYLLHWDPNGDIELIPPNKINIMWNSKSQMLMVDRKHPLTLYAPVFVNERHITSANQKLSKMIDDLPLPRRKPLQIYKNDFYEGTKRVEDLYMVQILIQQSPHVLTRKTDFIALQRSHISIKGDSLHYEISWRVRETPWRLSYYGNRQPLHQALDPTGIYTNETQLENLEMENVTRNMNQFAVDDPMRGVTLQRSITNFILHVRGEIINESSDRNELYTRMLQDCLIWVEDLKSKPTFPQAKTHQISLEHWGLIFNSIDSEPSSVFMRIYNWLVRKGENHDQYLNLSSKISSLIDDGLAQVRGIISQPVPSETSQNEGYSLKWRSEGGLDRKIAIYTVICKWAFFASLFTDIKELPI